MSEKLDADKLIEEAVVETKKRQSDRETLKRQEAVARCREHLIRMFEMKDDYTRQAQRMAEEIDAFADMIAEDPIEAAGRIIVTVGKAEDSCQS